MTKIIRITAIFVLIFAIFTIFSKNNVSYANENADEKSLEEETEEILNDLDTSELDEKYNNLSSDEKSKFGSTLKELILKIINGEIELSFENILNGFWDYFKSSILSFLPSIISVVAIAILGNILKSFNSGFLNDGTSELVVFICFVSAVTVIFSEVINIILSTLGLIENLEGIMSATFPILITLISSVGGGASGAFLKPIMSFCAVTFTSIIKNIVMPLFSASITLSIVGNLSPTIKLNKLSAFFKKCADYILIAIFSIYITCLTSFGLMGKTSYGVLINSYKFAIKSYVPVIGEYLSEGLDVAMAGCILIKNAVGISGLIIFGLYILEPIIKIIAFKWIVHFSSAILEPIGESKISDMLEGINKSLGLCLSSILGVAFMFFSLVMFTGSSFHFGV